MSFEKLNADDHNRPSTRHCVLVFGYNEEELKELQKYLEHMQVPEYIAVNKEMLGLSLEELLSDAIERPAFKGSVQAKAIVMSGFTGSEVDAFIKNFKDTSLPRPIFAMVTPTSAKWKFGELLKELILERAMMAKKRKPFKH